MKNVYFLAESVHNFQRTLGQSHGDQIALYSSYLSHETFLAILRNPAIGISTSVHNAVQLAMYANCTCKLYISHKAYWTEEKKRIYNTNVK